MLTKKAFDKLMKTPTDKRPDGWEEEVDQYYESQKRMARLPPTPETVDDIQPILNEDECVKEIHPAQDFTDDLGFISLYLLYPTDIGNRRLPTLVTSDRRLFLLTEDRENILEDNGFRKKYLPINLPNRWSEKALDYFLKNPDNDTEIKFVFEEIKNQLKFYFDWSDEVKYDFFAVWVIGTYFYQLFTSFPYVNLMGSKASGKSKLMFLCSLLAFNGYHVTNITPATLFRIVQNSRCSLLIDEAEYDKHEIKELQGLLSGYTKGTLVPRMTERKKKGVKGHEIEFFEVYSPKMLAGIHGVESILEDRCITIITQKANIKTKEGKIKANRYPDATEEKWTVIRDLCYSVMLEHFKDIRSSMNTIKSEVEKRFDVLDVILKSKLQDTRSSTDMLTLKTSNTSQTILKNGKVGTVNDVGNVETSQDERTISKFTDNDKRRNVTSEIDIVFNKLAENIDSRNLQLWLPLYSIAYNIGWDVFESMVNFSVRLIEQKKDVNYMEDRDTVVFINLLKNVKEKRLYTVASITSSLKADLGEQYWINERYVGKSLRRLDVVLGTSRGSRRSVLLDPEDIKEKADRFGIDVEDVIKVIEKEGQATLSDSLDFSKNEDELEGEDFLK